MSHITDPEKKLDSDGSSSPVASSVGLQSHQSQPYADAEKAAAEEAIPGGTPTDTIPLPSAEDRPACFRNTFQELFFVITATVAIAMSSFLQGGVIVVSFYIGEDLNMTTPEITWMTAASALTSGAFLLFFGKLADMFGRRSMFIGSLFIFSVLALGTGFAQNAITLDVLNGLMGLMSASAVPPAQGMLGAIYERPSKRKNKVFALYSSGNPLGFVFGCLSFGIAAHIFDWRASFFFLAIIYFVFSVIAALTVPKDDSPKLPWNMDSLKKFDLLGTFFTVFGFGLFSAALSLGGETNDSWKHPHVIVLLILGVLLIIAFFFWENYFTYPLMPMHIWRDRNFSLIIAILVLGFTSFYPSALWLALYMQRILSYGPLETALRLLPMAVVGIITNVFAGLVLHKISNKLLMAAGVVTYIAAFLLLGFHHEGAIYWALLFPGLALLVVGADLHFNVANMYVLSTMDKSQQSIAGSIFQTVAKLSGTIGIAVTTAIYNGVASNPSSSGFHAGDPFEPYAATYWFAAACAGISIVLVPFLTITTQGHSG